MTHDFRKHSSALGFYLGLLLAALSYLSLAGMMLFLLASGRRGWVV